MTDDRDASDQVDAIEAVALLDEPNRRRLYELVVASRTAVGRDEAAAALGISRELAAFHLDRLLASGLVRAEYGRRSGRSGPGAGRPAKLYRRTGREIAVSLPPRRYDRAAGVFAEGLSRLEGPAAAGAVAEVAGERGAALGVEARANAGPRPSRTSLRSALMDLLTREGYEPKVDAASGTVCLRNCPYHALATTHRDLTCTMNLAWAKGVASAVGARLQPELAPSPGYCCVVFRDTRGRPATRSRVPHHPVSKGG
ncbi:MAG: transcriptional regulator [Candidatus Limnocylindrales bacterium]